MRSFRNVSDIRFSPDKSGESLILSKLPGLRDWSRQNELRDYFKLSLGADSLKVTKEMFPREFEIYNEVLQTLGLTSQKHEFYISGEHQRNAFIFSSNEDSQMVMSTELLSLLDDDELRFVIGHEFGHFLCQHSRIPTRIITEHDEVDDDFKLDVLKWSRCAEISADRYGVLCCGKLDASLTALFKVAFGIKPISLGALRSSMRQQYETLSQLAKNRSHNNDMLSSRTHPIIPLRCVAIEITFMDIQSFKMANSWNKSAISFIDRELLEIIENLI